MTQERIGRYRILEEIASGGQATVYRVWDTQTGQVLALKVMHPHMARDPSYVERFHREARLAASITHPNVIRIFEVGEEDGKHFMALEFLPLSLHHLIQAEGRMPLERAVDIAHQVALGLEAAHEHGIIHRDIKPQNILISPEGTAKVTDFGIGRATDLSTMTRTGAVMGTPHYMSPEQARGLRVDIRADIYSLGIALYQMLTGELPFDADTPWEVIRQHIDTKPPAVRRGRPDVPRALEQIVDRCLEKDPERRYATPLELAQALERAMPGAISATAPPAAARPQAPASPPPAPPTPPRPAAPPPPPPRPAAPARARRGGFPWVWALSLVALAVVAVAVVIGLTDLFGVRGSPSLPVEMPAASTPTPTATATATPTATSTPTPTPSPAHHPYGKPIAGGDLEQVTPELVRSEGLLVDLGLLVRRVFPSTALEEAGLREGDVLVRVADTSISTLDDLQTAIAGRVGSQVVFTYFRGSVQLDGTAIIGAFHNTGRIPPGSTERINLYLLQGQRVEYYWQGNTSATDVDFSVIDPGGNAEVPKRRAVKYRGSIFASETGRYILVFDNSFSIFTGKTIWLYYKIYPM